MFPVFQIRKGSQGPSLEVQINAEGLPTVPSIEGVCGRPVPFTKGLDLTGKTVTAYMIKCGRQPAPVTLNGTLVVVDAPNGIVRYDWGTSDTINDGGYYFGFNISDSPTGPTMVWPFVKEQFVIEVTE